MRYAVEPGRSGWRNQCGWLKKPDLLLALLPERTVCDAGHHSHANAGSRESEADERRRSATACGPPGAKYSKAEALERHEMTRVTLGVVLGLGFGVVDVLMMLPLSFPDKRAALLGAFCARFALGVFAATIRLSLPPVVSGVVVGVLTSLPDAIITKAYAPILVTGIVFGALAGWIVGRWAGPA